MLLKTLLCRQGRDNALRILAINAAGFVCLSLICILFPNSLIILLFAALLLPVIIFSAQRRLNDAGKSSGLAWLICLPLAGFGLALYFSAPLGVLGGLFLFGLASAGYLAFFPGIKQPSSDYVHGYVGPHQIQAFKREEVRFRHEPTLGGQALDNSTQVNFTPKNEVLLNEALGDLDVGLSPVELAAAQGVASSNPEISVEPAFNLKDDDLEDDVLGYRKENTRDSPRWHVDQDALKSGSITELVKTWLIWGDKHRKPLTLGAKVLGAVSAAILIGYAVAALVGFISNLSFGDNDGPEEFNGPAQVAAQVSKVTFPDGFELVLYGDILAFRWLGDDGDTHDLWRLDTAKGDKRCAELVFNNGSKYRPLQVSLLNDSATEAKFSPLDTQAIINDIALRGSVKICGFNFSLKGSQSALGQNSRFSDFISY